MNIVTAALITGVTSFFAAISCNRSSCDKKDKTTSDTTVPMRTTRRVAFSQEATGMLPTDTSIVQPGKEAIVEARPQFSIEQMVKDYLALKNALVEDNAKAAAAAGDRLLATLMKMYDSETYRQKHKEYIHIANAARENAKHIGSSAGDIEHQRTHLAALSKNMADFIALFGSSQKLYQNHCYMFIEGERVIWISEERAIRNPYFGSRMIGCGSVMKIY